MPSRPTLLFALALFLVVTGALVRVAHGRRDAMTERVRFLIEFQRGSCSQNYPCADEVPPLLKAGADANGKVKNGNSFLLFAAHRRDTQLMGWLEKHGAKVDARVRTEKLCLAANGGTTRKVQALLDAGTPVNARADDGRTALEVAIYNNETHGPKMALFLLSRGADAKIKARNGSEMIPLALLFGGDVKILSALQKAGAPTSPAAALALAALRNQPKEVRRLLAAGVSVDSRASAKEWTALQWAAYDGRFEVCQALLEAGASPSARTRGGQNDDNAIQLARKKLLDAPKARVKEFERTVRLLERAAKK